MEEDRNRDFKIVPRLAALGGGWRLTLLENGEEAGGGIFPLPEEGPEAGITWWNSISAKQRGHWLMMAISLLPADARHAYLLAVAYEDARQNGEIWVRKG